MSSAWLVFFLLVLFAIFWAADFTLASLASSPSWGESDPCPRRFRWTSRWKPCAQVHFELRSHCNVKPLRCGKTPPQSITHKLSLTGFAMSHITLNNIKWHHLFRTTNCMEQSLHLAQAENLIVVGYRYSNKRVRCESAIKFLKRSHLESVDWKCHLLSHNKFFCLQVRE